MKMGIERATKVLTFFQLIGFIPLLGLLTATISSHVIWYQDDGGVLLDAESNQTQPGRKPLATLAIEFTAAYSACFLYGFETVVISILFLLKKPLSDSISSAIIFSASDALFAICAGGIIYTSAEAGYKNGAGLAIISLIFLLLTIKAFPMLLAKFDVLEASSKKNIPFKLMTVIGIGVVGFGCFAVLTYAGSVLAILTGSYHHQDKALVAISLIHINLPIFSTATIIASVCSLLVWKVNRIAYTVDVISFFGQIAIGYSLNEIIFYLYGFYAFWKENSDDKALGIFYTAHYSLIGSGGIMIIFCVGVSIIRPFISVNRKASEEDDEKTALMEMEHREY